MRGGRIMKRLSVLSLLFVLAAPAVARVGVINLGLAYYDVTTEVATPRDAGAEPARTCRIAASRTRQRPLSRPTGVSGSLD